MEVGRSSVQISRARISTLLWNDPRSGLIGWNNSLTTRALQKTKSGWDLMFKPQSLKEVINLARMRDDQLAGKEGSCGYHLESSDSSSTSHSVALLHLQNPLSFCLGKKCIGREHKVTCIVGMVLINKLEDDHDDTQLHQQPFGKPMETFPVRVANGERLTCQGRYDKVLILSLAFNGLKCWDLWFVTGNS
ncbi:hypothetical protein CK203_093812 [Vitis vinifera]|uniref:Uncharacterized protein n=1 Tax=Vitis vinifera TaxID=29760 RepID=A0A438C7Q3_VITVI|nr:hypothetical protein CK203_093812 [Vitis vinifera]